MYVCIHMCWSPTACDEWICWNNFSVHSRTGTLLKCGEYAGRYCSHFRQIEVGGQPTQWPSDRKMIGVLLLQLKAPDLAHYCGFHQRSPSPITMCADVYQFIAALMTPLICLNMKVCKLLQYIDWQIESWANRPEWGMPFFVRHLHLPSAIRRCSMFKLFPAHLLFAGIVYLYVLYVLV